MKRWMEFQMLEHFFKKLNMFALFCLQCFWRTKQFLHSVTQQPLPSFDCLKECRSVTTVTTNTKKHYYYYIINNKAKRFKRMSPLTLKHHALCYLDVACLPTEGIYCCFTGGQNRWEFPLAFWKHLRKTATLNFCLVLKKSTWRKMKWVAESRWVLKHAHLLRHVFTHALFKCYFTNDFNRQAGNCV